MTEDIQQETSAAQRPVGRRLRRGVTRPLRSIALATICLVAVSAVVGFVIFARVVAGSAPPADPRADGIVVLTGGSARIDGALQLLAEGRADRLLISGVNPAVSLETLAATVGPASRPALDCCVDFDNARDTIENASETRQWAESRGFRSLIVVTSDYHMPRTMTELADAMPDVELIAFPVSNPDLRLWDWWRDSAAFALLAREYGKYLAAEARQLLPRSASASAAGL